MTPTPTPAVSPRLAALVARRREAGAGFWAATRAGDATSAADFDRDADELDALIAAEAVPAVAPAAPLAVSDPAVVTGLTSLICRHLPYALPTHCSPIDPTAQAHALAREHYDALTAGDCGLTPLRATLAGLGVTTTTAVAKALRHELLRESMWRATGGLPFAARETR